MNNVLNFNNFLKDKNYFSILTFCVLSSVITQSFLYSSLDYLALNIKNNEDSFYNYATIAATAWSIPQASSILLGFIISYINYKKLITISCCNLFILSMIALFFHYSYTLYFIWVIICGITLNAILLSVFQQIYTLLADKIADLYSDMVLFTTLGNVIGYRLSNVIYNMVGIRGIIFSFLLTLLIIFIYLRKIPETKQVETKSETTYNIFNVISIILKHKKLSIYLTIMLSIVLCNSGIVLLITTKIHHNHLHNTVFANIMSAIAIGGFIGALLTKNVKIQQIKNRYIQSATLFIFAICIINLNWFNTIIPLTIVFILFGIANSLFLVNMNTTLANFVIKSKDLVNISSIITGYIMSSFYLVTLAGPFIFKHLLQNQINYSSILLTVAMLNILFMIIILIIKPNKLELHTPKYVIISQKLTHDNQIIFLIKNKQTKTTVVGYADKIINDYEIINNMQSRDILTIGYVFATNNLSNFNHKSR